MVWLILMIVAIVMLASYGVLVESVDFTSVLGESMTSWFFGQNIASWFFGKDITVMTMDVVWAIIIGGVIMAIGLGLLYLDSRQALLEMYGGNNRYKVWPKLIGSWMWNDIVNASRFDVLAQIPVHLARFVVVAYAAKAAIGFGMIFGSFAMPWAIDWIGNALSFWINKSVTSTILNLGVSLLNLMVNQFGMLAFAYASIVLFADRFHHDEQTFYNDYAIMQRQRSEQE